MDCNECKLVHLWKLSRLPRKWGPYHINATCSFTRLKFEVQNIYEGHTWYTKAVCVELYI